MEVYYLSTELETLKIILYAYDKFDIEKQYDRYGNKIKESQLSKKIREYINLIGQDKLIELIKISKDKKEFYKLLNKNYNDSEEDFKDTSLKEKLCKK